MRFRNLDPVPDLHSQLDALLHCVWECEARARTYDRLNAAIDQDERNQRLKEWHERLKEWHERNQPRD